MLAAVGIFICLFITGIGIGGFLISFMIGTDLQDKFLFFFIAATGILGGSLLTLFLGEC